MLIGQASINLSANVLSALLGLLSVFIFTRLFSPHDYGVYLLGMAFAAIVSVFLAGWFRNLIMSRHARDDGTDVRGLVVSGYLVGCLAAPAAYGLGRLLGLDAMEALAAVGLAVAIGAFELTQELVRARLMVVTAMKATLVRAVAALGLGVAAAFLGKTGILLLVSSTLAYLLAVLVQRSAWRGTVLKFDGAGLKAAAKQGLPLTLSLTLLAISSVADRFIIANLVSTADAAQYVAGLDLVRQAVMMPAFSIAAAFVPLAIRINANQGTAAVQSHLGECVELLLSVTLPACLGFAVISAHIANVVLGADFRVMAAETMPIVAGAVIFQILTQQYLHTSFLLSGRSSFYLINTASIIVVNVDPVIRADQRLRHHRRGLGTAWRRSVRLRLRPGPQPPGISDPVSAPAHRTSDHRRAVHGVAGRGRRPASAGFRSDRVPRSVRRRNRQLRGPVLDVRHLAYPQAA